VWRCAQSACGAVDCFLLVHRKRILCTLGQIVWGQTYGTGCDDEPRGGEGCVVQDSTVSGSDGRQQANMA
jgi:hypothetical protein